MAKIRGIEFEENLRNAMGLEFYNLSHRFGYQSPNWPYFEDVKIERIHYMAKSGVLSQRITTSMHNTTHIDAPAHVVQGTPFIDEVPLPHFFGSGIVVSIPKKKWEPITYDDLEKAAGKHVRPRDVIIVNTGWHHQYEDSEDYFCRAPGFVPSAGKWFVEKQVKVIGHDTQANDHRPAAQRPAASASGRRIQGMVGRARLERRLSGMGAGAPHPLQQRHPRHRECRWRTRQGDGTALHLRLLPVELGSRRRLHHPTGRHCRSQR
jgi:kynurenine formamidase